MSLPVGEFDIILADPPWRYMGHFGRKDDNNNRSCTLNTIYQYPTMPLAEILALQPPKAPSAVLFLWVPVGILEWGLQVMKAWGFIYKSMAVWDKIGNIDKANLSTYFALQHEILLFGTVGRCLIPRVRPSSIIRARRRGHSVKPPIVYRLIEDMYPQTSKIELFAREKREGWTVWGNEIPKSTQTLLKTPQPRNPTWDIDGAGGIA